MARERGRDLPVLIAPLIPRMGDSMGFALGAEGFAGAQALPEALANQNLV